MLRKLLSRNAKQLLTPTLFILAIIGIAWHIQNNLFIHWDISWFLGACQKMLAGGTYTNDFFAPSTPMILYLYLPVVLLSKITHIAEFTLFKFYIFLIASLSLSLCYFLLNKILSKNEVFLKNILTISLCLTYLIFPLFNLGQRDHLIFIMIMPYLLIAACRLEKITIPTTIAIIIGLIAGLGFPIKPQFFSIFALVELSILIHDKSLQSLRRPEALTIILALSCFITTVFIFNPDYVFFMLPYLLKYYYQDVAKPLSYIFDNGLINFSFLTFFSALILYKYQPHKNLLTVLSASWIGFAFCYFSQVSGYYYHLIPLLSISFIIFTLLYTIFIFKNDISLYELIAWIIIDFIAMMIIIVYLPIALTMIVMLFSLGLSLLKATKQNYLRVIFNVLTGTFILIIPAQILYNVYLVNKERNIHYFVPIANAVHTQIKNHSLAVYGDLTLGIPPELFKIGLQRMDSLWMVRYLVKNEHWELIGKHLPTDIVQNTLFSNMVIGDLQNKKPDYILLDRSDRTITLTDLHHSFQFVRLQSKQDILTTPYKNNTIFIINENNRYHAYVLFSSEVSEPITILMDANDLSVLNKQAYNQIIHSNIAHYELLSHIVNAINLQRFYLKPHFDFFTYFKANPAFQKEWKNYRLCKTITVNFLTRSDWLLYKRLP